MKIIINGIENDYSVEEASKETLDDLVGALVGSLNRQGFVQFSFFMGDKALHTIEQWQTFNLKKVENLRIEAIIALELEECLTKTGVLLAALKLNDKVLLQTTQGTENQWQRFLSSLDFWLTDFTMADDDLQKIADCVNLSEQEREQALSFVEELISLLTQKDRELSNPTGELLEAIKVLQGFKTELLSLSALFNQGLDQKAMQKMVDFSVVVHKFERCSSFLDENCADLRDLCSTFCVDMSGQLNAFSDACTAKDYVLAGDIAEYEMAERLDLLEKIEKKLMGVM
jgi:hypothetical protein